MKKLSMIFSSYFYFCLMHGYGEKIIAFYRSLQPPSHFPEGVEILYPQRHENVLKIVETFFHKYYADDRPRRLIFGINPGRFGAGTTGINFTAPRQLKNFCGIDHSFKDQSELSAEFIYEMIGQYGGPEKFYSHFFITSISPLGFIKNGLNLNYYDDKALQENVRPFIIQSIQQQLSLGFKNDYSFCIGGDKNLKFFSALNKEYQFFEKIIPLPHPRFIMQYRRKQKQSFIEQYLDAFSHVPALHE